MRLRRLLYVIIGIPVFIIMVWLFAVPSDLMKEQIENSIAQSGSANVEAEIKGFRKGLFLTIFADSIELNVDKAPALSITDLSFHFDPGHLIHGDLALLINGKIGTGTVIGLVKFPPWGEIKIEKAELDAISYLTRFGIRINGSVFSDININDDTVKVIFEVPDLSIDESTTIIPLLSTFRRLQGGLSVKGNNIVIDSISLEGEKGYARLKGNITNNNMNMALEVMPVAEKLTTLESMLIGKYIVSPGYYVVPVKGPLKLK